MLYKDKYYVTCGWLLNQSKRFPLHYIFKQRITSRDLMPYLDAIGSNSNGWAVFQTEVYRGHSDYKTYVREATPEEILQYDTIGKPCMSRIVKIDNFKANLKAFKV